MWFSSGITCSDMALPSKTVPKGQARLLRAFAPGGPQGHGIPGAPLRRSQPGVGTTRCKWADEPRRLGKVKAAPHVGRRAASRGSASGR